ncbi:MAG: ThiF family adenylyltransferase, partial [Planctomycetota bacterium]
SKAARSEGDPGSKAARSEGNPGSKATRSEGDPGSKAARSEGDPGSKAARSEGNPGSKATRSEGNPGSKAARSEGDPGGGGAGSTEGSDDGDATQDRFDRQTRFAPLGAEGQERLSQSRALLVGCGALGGVLAQTLVRAGVGELTLVDRDVVELSNLPRQVLFEERHALEEVPKVDAAEETLTRIGGPTRLRPHAAHLDGRNLERLAKGADVLLDGTDNLPTRYLLNDFAVARGVPWVYAGVVGAEGLVLAIRPGSGPCLRCVFPEPPPPGTLATCDTAGVILPAVGAVASLAAGLALRLLAGRGDDLAPALLSIDAWSGRVRTIQLARDPDCPTCARGELPFLEAAPSRKPVVLCGRGAVQVVGVAAAPDPDALFERVQSVASDARRSGDLLRFTVDGHRLTVFPDGRALIEGTEDPDRARALYDRWIGS